MTVLFFDEFFREIIRILKQQWMLNRRLLRVISVRHRIIAMRHDWDLEKGRQKVLVTGKLSGLYILNKGDGNFTLRFQFGKTKLESFTLDQDDFDNGDFYEWDIRKLYLTNTAQAGKTLSVIVEEER